MELFVIRIRGGLLLCCRCYYSRCNCCRLLLFLLLLCRQSLCGMVCLPCGITTLSSSSNLLLLLVAIIPRLTVIILIIPTTTAIVLILILLLLIIVHSMVAVLILMEIIVIILVRAGHDARDGFFTHNNFNIILRFIACLNGGTRHRDDP